MTRTRYSWVMSTDPHAQARQTAEAIRDAVTAGRTVWTRAPHGWMVVGPAADITVGAVVTVTRRDGTSELVTITRAQEPMTLSTLAYCVADAERVRMASDAQRRYAADLGVAIPAGTTAQAASALIEDALAARAQARQSTGASCHYCGLPTTRGECAECGPPL